MPPRKNQKSPPPPPSAAAEVADDVPEVLDWELARRKLRGLWELASVLNFLIVFEPLIKSNLKASAEDIEAALIKPNKLLSQIHIALLKGIRPISKNLNSSDAWVTVLCRKLSEWWPWVAEGDLPLTVAKGVEISKYKDLDPAIRLRILKALCEIRAIQDDAVSYVNGAIKSGSELSTFRKDKICGNENGTAYWLDGNETIGYRLYKEVTQFDSGPKVRGGGNMSTVNFQWETLATNLEEFLKVADEFSSSKVKIEVAVSKAVETDVVPILQKLHKKNERASKQQQREQTLLSGFRNSGISRSSRSRRPVNYTFDAYDKAIDEAITMHQTKKLKTGKKGGQAKKQGKSVKEMKVASHDSSDSDMRDSESTENDTESGAHQGGDIDEISEDESKDEQTESESENGDEYNNDEKTESGSETGDEYDNDEKTESGSETGDESNKDEKTEYGSEDGSASNKSDEENDEKPKAQRWSKRVGGLAASPGAKNNLRQRPTRNSALLAPDYEDESSQENLSDMSRSTGSSSSSPTSNSNDESNS